MRMEDEKTRTFLDVLLDLYDQGEIDIDGIREEVDTIMFAGHDTVAASLCWILYNIGRHPEIQERVDKEINTVAQQQECLLIDRVCNLKYTECVIKESMRLNPLCQVSVGLHVKK